MYYTGENFPTEYRGNLFHLEFVLNRLYRTVLEGDAVVQHSVFWNGEGGPVDLAQGPDDALYLCELYTGEIQRIAFEAGPTTVAGETVAEPDRRPVLLLCGAGAGAALVASVLGLLGGRVYRRRSRR